MNPAEEDAEAGKAQLELLVAELGQIERLIQQLDPQEGVTRAGEPRPFVLDVIRPDAFSSLRDLRRRQIEVRQAMRALLRQASKPTDG